MSAIEPSLLLVDDDPSAIQVMSKMLAHYPHQRFATSGEVALLLAREAAPDLILLDADMPGMTGFDVCAALQKDPVLARVPVIFATSHDHPELEAAALQSGATDFVTKPLIAAQLIARVRTQLQAKQRLEELEYARLAAGIAPREPRLAKPRILIVDDDEGAIRIMENALGNIGDCQFATTGEEAFRLAREFAPQLILLDLHMPDGDGFAVCACLKAIPTLEHVPIVFVTRFSDARIEKRALELGAADFITKPYKRTVLQARIRKLLSLMQRAEAEMGQAQ